MQPPLSPIDLVLARKWTFLAVFFVIFTLTYAAFAAFDVLPEPVKTTPVTAPSTTPVTTMTTPVVPVTPVVAATTVRNSNVPGELPKTLTIDSLGRTITVLNPAARSVASLDAALLTGVARHPDSAELGQDGNVFILGHSSYLPVVNNKNFQAFNGIQNLKWGDTIRVNSATTEYVYRVDKVYKAKASALTIPIAETGKLLTLATCNCFGTKDDRFIVEASLQSTKTLTQALR